MRVLVFGATGMLGKAVFRVLSENTCYEVWGTIRSNDDRHHFTSAQDRIISGVDVLNVDALVNVLNRVKPDVVINCIGLVKQLAESSNPLHVLPVNAMLPHRLANLCGLANARLIHVSTDCVFSGRKGNYTEADISDSEDLYGKSKYIGEVNDLPHAITLRTSIIGHESKTRHSLVDWFLSQEGNVKGYTKAIFSGLPTVELARVIDEYVLPNPDLSGLYHVSAEPISKYDLLQLIATEYGKKITIEPDGHVMIDRSLGSGRFSSATGYVAPHWPELVKLMRRHQ